MKYQMNEYQKLINQLRMLRADLDEKAIVLNAEAFARESDIRVQEAAQYFSLLAMCGYPLPWEDGYKTEWTDAIQGMRVAVECGGAAGRGLALSMAELREALQAFAEVRARI